MEYYKEIILKDGSVCILRSGRAADGAAALENFRLVHAQTDFLLSYPEENRMTAEEEAAFLAAKAESPNAVELLAELDGRIAGLAGVDPIGRREKLRHRAGFGISIDRAYWGRGIGRALTQACIECAKSAGYMQLELDVVAENTAAVSLYQSLGFTEYGRNPMGFLSRTAGMQTLVMMRLDLRG